jgi:hypothetical protein
LNDNLEKIFCDNSVGKAFKGSLWFADRMSGPLIGRDDAPLTGDDGLVRVGDVGKDT